MSSATYYVSVSRMDALIIFLVLLFAFGVPSVIAFLIYYFGEIRKPLEFARMGKYEEFAKAQKTTHEREVIVKEIVMIRCQYCGGLMPQASAFCPGVARETRRELLHTQAHRRTFLCLVPKKIGTRTQKQS